MSDDAKTLIEQLQINGWLVDDLSRVQAENRGLKRKLEQAEQRLQIATNECRRLKLQRNSTALQLENEGLRNRLDAAKKTAALFLAGGVGEIKSSHSK